MFEIYIRPILSGLDKLVLLDADRSGLVVASQCHNRKLKEHAHVVFVEVRSVGRQIVR